MKQLERLMKKMAQKENVRLIAYAVSLMLFASAVLLPACTVDAMDSAQAQSGSVDVAQMRGADPALAQSDSAALPQTQIADPVLTLAQSGGADLPRIQAAGIEMSAYAVKSSLQVDDVDWAAEYLHSQGVIIVEDNKEMKEDLIGRMYDHETEIRYYYDGIKEDYQSWVNLMLSTNKAKQEKAYAKIGKLVRSYDEYLAGNAYSRGIGTRIYTIGDEEYYCVTFLFGYYTTKSQEKKVDAAAEKLAEKYQDKTTYQKVKLTHDYLKKKITYKSGYNGSYNALIKGKSVCNGYALSFTRIMQEMGVPCKYVTGTGDGGAHAWNMVKIGKYWYNIDVTWDDTAKTNAYFLKSDKEFKNHVRENEDQYAKLNIAKKSYKK